MCVCVCSTGGTRATTTSPAQVLAEAVGQSRTMVSLDVAYNMIGYDGALALAQGIVQSQTFQHLDVESTNLDAEACLSGD